MLRNPARPPVGRPQTATDDRAGADAALAGLVRETLIELARHSTLYADLFADRAGARLAHHVSAGQIQQLSEEGRAAMRAVYLGMQAALTVPPRCLQPLFVEGPGSSYGAASRSRTA